MSDGAERVARHHNNQRKRGLRLVRVWVPAKNVRRIQEQAKAHRAKAGLPLPADGAPPFPGWAYVQLGRQDGKLRERIKQNGGRWIREV